MGGDCGIAFQHALAALASVVFAGGATFNVVTYGAIPDDGLSDSVAFRAATAAACAAHSGTNMVLMPAGTWFLPRIDNRSAVYVFECTGVTFTGVGRGKTCAYSPPSYTAPVCSSAASPTILQGSVGSLTGDYMFFAVEDSVGIEFHDLQCDGRKASISGADEQTHCLEFAGTDDIVLDDLYFHHMYGDSAKFKGTVARGECDGIDSDDTLHEDNGRSGYAFAGGLDVTLTNVKSLRISDQNVDLEPFDGIVGLTIRDSYLGTPVSAAAALTLSGSNTPTTDVLVQNTFIGGEIQALELVGAEFDNILMLSGTTSFGFDLQRHIEDIYIHDSAIAVTGSMDAIALTAANTTEYPSGVVLSKVRITVDAGRAFTFEGGDGDITFNGVTIRVPNPPQNVNGTGIRIASAQTAPVMASMVLAGLDITGVQFGAVVSRAGGKALITGPTMSGTISNAAPASSIGVFCNGTAVAPTLTGLTITSDTSTSGCP